MKNASVLAPANPDPSARPTAIGPEGRTLLRSIRLHGGTMPAAGVDNRPLLVRLVALGLIARAGQGYALLCLTAKGERKLDAMMRCE